MTTVMEWWPGCPNRGSCLLFDFKESIKSIADKKQSDYTSSICNLFHFRKIKKHFNKEEISEVDQLR